ncbi:hypothetical protein [Streptomyces vilmorinianum]|uniref:hypothetical protein n=1 Tax=Streptomyces vilmorinianum TaxID=3051092 RepID=UPI0010FB288D
MYAASGRHAYEGSYVAAVQYEVVHGAPRLDRVPPPLQPLIGACLAPDPASRPLPDQIIQSSAPPRGAERAWRHGLIAHDITTREHSLGFPFRLDLRNGKPTDWPYTGLFECDPPSPLVVQGNGLWSVAVNEKQGGIDVIDLSPQGRPPWVFPITKTPDLYWITGDANRVFLLDGPSLTALPVF